MKNHIAEELQKRDWSQAALAERLGVSLQTVSDPVKRGLLSCI